MPSNELKDPTLQILIFKILNLLNETNNSIYPKKMACPNVMSIFGQCRGFFFNVMSIIKPIIFWYFDLNE